MTIPSRHLGDTRSGKKICLYDTSDLEYIRLQLSEFEEKDHFDAFCMFQYFSVRAIRQYGRSSDGAITMERMSDFHGSCIDAIFREQEMQLLSLVTSVDLMNHGKSLVKSVHRE